LDKIRRYPLLRALRVDKMTLAAFEATLRLYMEGKTEEIPTLRLITQPGEILKKKARHLASMIKRLTGLQVRAVATHDAVGGGAYPTAVLEGFGVEVEPPEGISDGTALERLRRAPVPVIATAKEGKILLHVRTLLEGDEPNVVEALESLLTREEDHDREN
jgi:L-seryl-tRNA(Ser) seleniumtransferase